MRRYRAEIDYHHKKVQFRLKNRDQFDFGEKRIKSMMTSAMKAKRKMVK